LVTPNSFRAKIPGVGQHQRRSNIAMSEPLELPQVQQKPVSLRDAIRRIRLVNTEQSDGFADLRDTERARLEVLADALADLFAEVPDDLDFFTFALSNGETPRLWIDLTCHVALGRDMRSYRLLKDTRLGRTVLYESADREEMTTRITDYVAERILDRQRAIEGDWLELKTRKTGKAAEPAQSVPSSTGPSTTYAAANEDVPPGRKVRGRRPTDTATNLTAANPAAGPKWVAFFVGALIGASVLAAIMVANGRL